MITLNAVTKSFCEKIVLQNFSLTLPDRQTIALTGPSGCGKTTLLRLIAGLEKPDSGSISLQNCGKLAVVFQEDRLLEALTVRENILIVLDKNKQARKTADECLLRLGLSDAAQEYPKALSGGMKRRVAIARAIAYGGEILLLDEPFKGLDTAIKKQTMDFVFEKKAQRITLMITHDSAEAAAADQIITFTGLPLTVLS